MEKQGMDRRKRIFRPGLLILPLLLFFFSAGMLFSQTDEGGASEPDEVEAAPEPLEVRLETSAAAAVVNTPWAAYVLVNHPRPSEVNVRPPRFPPALVLERVRTETRLIRPPPPEAPAEGAADVPETPPQSDRWTRVEFLFTPQRVGTVTLAPFEVTVLERQASTRELNLRIREEVRTVRRYEPRFRWVDNPAIPAGERGELSLELGGWDPQKDAPRGIFRGKTPANAIVEEQPPVPVREGVFRYAVSVIPLEEGEVSFDTFTFQAENFNLTVPAVKVQVLPALPETAAPEQSADTPRQEETAEEILPPAESSNISPRPFPEYQEKVFFFFREDYKRITASVKKLWEEGRHVEALAEIRRNERDSLPGPFLIPLRGKMEQSLGLGLTADERWRPLKIPLLAWVVFGFVVISALVVLLVFRPRSRINRAETRLDEDLPDEFTGENRAPRPRYPEKSVTSPRRGGFKTVIILVLAMGAALVFLEEGMGNFLMGNFLIKRLGAVGRTAVLEGTPAYRVPDTKGAVNTRFGEGQPVTVSDYRGDWCYAESHDGRSGWVHREAVVIY